ncbi:MAG TPA: hypothetical protein VFB04_16770 [Terriglobales bacterium]|nr:hypothetical protein [Terriglobales bacterium]
MTASAALTPTPKDPKKPLVRRALGWLLTVVAALVVLFAIAVLNNNYALHHRSRTEFNAQLNRAIERSTQWIVTHPENYGNPPLMFMIGDMADMSADPRLQQYVQGYLASDRVHLPGHPQTWYYAHWAFPTLSVPVVPREVVPYFSWQDRWFSYASAPDKVDITPEDHADLFSPNKYSWGIRLHLQLIALDIYRRFNGPSPELNAAINPVAEGVAHDAFWDFRVNDAYYQRNATILGAGRPDLIRSRWIERMLDAQNDDGTWNFCWHGWCRGVLEFSLNENDYGHSTVQGAWALYMLKYRYGDWIAKNYQ